MATSAWLRGPSAMRLTEGLVSVLKEQRPDYIPVLLSGYREHGVFHTQVYPDLKMPICSRASYLCATALQAPSLSRVMLGTLEQEHFGYKLMVSSVETLFVFFLLFYGYLFRVQAPWPVSLASPMPNLAQARPGDQKRKTCTFFPRCSINSPLIHKIIIEG